MTGRYHAALIRLFRENFNLRSSERVLVFADRPRRGDASWTRQYRCAREAAAVARGMAREVRFVEYDSTGTHGVEPPEEVWEAFFGSEAVAALRRGRLLSKILRKGAAVRELAAAARVLKRAGGLTPQVVVGLARYSTSHTRFRGFANDLGARYGSMPLFDPKMFQGPMAVDWREVSRRTRKCARLFTRAERVVVTSPNGTSLRFDLSGRRGLSDDGLLHRPGAFGNLPAGEVFTAPREGRTQGVLVVEWSLTGRLRRPMVLWIRDGEIHEIEGKGPEAALLRKKKRENPDNARVAELGVGTNPGASRPDNILESEKILGTIHVAFGDNHSFGGRINTPFHQDYVVFRASLRVELPGGRRREVLREGSWML